MRASSDAASSLFPLDLFSLDGLSVQNIAGKVGRIVGQSPSLREPSQRHSIA
jgi:hypothetical protein